MDPVGKPLPTFYGSGRARGGGASSYPITLDNVWYNRPKQGAASDAVAPWSGDRNVDGESVGAIDGGQLYYLAV